ncbi:MAG: hypothetical protein J7578_04440 [Chitinophagaceae bacterium]|nr:hypothetical protein [Chitinophagaceae bacterium]
MNRKQFTCILILSMIVSSCQKNSGGSSSNAFGEGNGNYSFYATSDLGVGNIAVYIDNELAGTLTRYHANGVECGKAEVNVIKSRGPHLFRASSQSGANWPERTINFEEGKCTAIELTGSGNNGLPGQYKNQGTIAVKGTNLQICARDWDAIDGDIITIIVNGNTIASSVSMTATNKCWNVKVNNGNNWIGIICNSPGTTEAASPRIEVNDGVTTQGFNILAYPDQPGAYIIRLN